MPRTKHCLAWTPHTSPAAGPPTAFRRGPGSGLRSAPSPSPPSPSAAGAPALALRPAPTPTGSVRRTPAASAHSWASPPRIPSRPCSSLSWPPLSLVPMLLPTPRACPHVLWALSSGLLLSSPAGLGSLATDLQPARPHVSSRLQASQCCGHCRGLGTSRGPFPPRLLGRQGQGACGCANHSVVPDHGGRLLNVNEGKRGRTEVPAAEGHTRGSREG